MAEYTAPQVVVHLSGTEMKENYQGEWVTGKKYLPGQWVSKSKFLYTCLAENYENEPAKFPEYWRLLGQLGGE